MKSSSDSEERADYLLIGKIAGVHGIRGNVKVISYADDPGVFDTDKPFLVVDDRGSSHFHTVAWVQTHRRGLLLAFENVQDRNDAEALIRAEIYIKKSDLPALEEGTYYWFEMIGLSVFDGDGGFLGRIDSVMPTGSNDVYVIRDRERGRDYELLIPALASVVRTVDLDAGRMVVDLPEGL